MRGRLGRAERALTLTLTHSLFGTNRPNNSELAPAPPLSFGFWFSPPPRRRAKKHKKAQLYSREQRAQAEVYCEFLAERQGVRAWERGEGWLVHGQRTK